MSYIHEYLDRMQKEGLSIIDLQQELSKQLGAINQEWDCYSFIFASAMNKHVPGAGLNSDDFQVIYDMLKDVNHRRILMILQTSGGCGQTAERIAKYLHNKFEEVHFLIAGEALSAGTILALSGHEILMTENGSLGPIDAQMNIGRSWVSAHDYITWMENLVQQVNTNGGVHPVDATILAQITPGELQGVNTALNFAIDRVEEWLARYKFRDWTITADRGVAVDEDFRKQRAHEIAKELTNQQRWRSHGTRLSIEDLERLKLKVIKVEEHKSISEPVARIHALLWVIFGTSSVFKTYADVEKRINRQAVQGDPQPHPRNAEMLQMIVKCPACAKDHMIFLRLKDTAATRAALAENLQNLFPKDNKLTCPCGFVIDLTGHRAHIENESGNKIIEDQQEGDGHESE